jgi:four helix bundle protein
LKGKQRIKSIQFRDFRSLIVYQKALELSDRVYEITKTFPAEERFRLSDQMIRAANSIAGNIAESEQLYKKKKLSFLSIAVGSTNEVKCWLDIAYRQKYIDLTIFNELEERSNEILRILYKLLNNLR